MITTCRTPSASGGSARQIYTCRTPSASGGAQCHIYTQSFTPYLRRPTRVDLSPLTTLTSGVPHIIIKKPGVLPVYLGQRIKLTRQHKVSFPPPYPLYPQAPCLPSQPIKPHLYKQIKIFHVAKTVYTHFLRLRKRAQNALHSCGGCFYGF